MWDVTLLQVLKVEIVTTEEVKVKEVPLPPLVIKSETPLVVPEMKKPLLLSSTIEPIYEEDFYAEGEFTYDEYGNIIGRVTNQLARDRWHWAFTKIVQVRINLFKDLMLRLDFFSYLILFRDQPEVGGINNFLPNEIIKF